MNGKTKSALKLGLWVTIAVLLTNFLLGMVGYQVKELFGVTPATGITSTLGNKVIQIFQNLISFDIASLFAVYISAVIIVFAGDFIKSTFKFPKGETAWQKTALTLFYGTIPFYILFVGLGLPAFGTIIGLGAYYVGVAIVLGVLQNLNIKLI